MKPELRQCLVQVPDHSKPTRSPIYKEVPAHFHVWGIDDEGRSASIVEMDDGTIEFVPVNQIKFVKD